MTTSHGIDRSGISGGAGAIQAETGTGAFVRADNPTISNATLTGATSGNTLALTVALPITSGGTGSSSASAALIALAALPLAGGTLTGTLNGTIGAFSGELSGSTASGAMIATQDQQEAGTSVVTLVTPGRQQYHPSAAKGWVKAAIDSTIASSYNVTSLVDVGPGQVDVTWNVDFSSASNVCVATAQTNSNVIRVTAVDNSSVPTAGVTRINTINTGDGALTDPNYYHIVSYGDQ